MTAQATDHLSFQGKEYWLLTMPLSHYFGVRVQWPAFRAADTANWRGYTASWTISDGRLLLIDIRGQVCTREPEEGAQTTPWCQVGHSGECNLRLYTLIDLFPDGHPVWASWYSGELEVAHGHIIRYVHQGFGSTYAQTLKLTVERGLVTNVEQYDAPSFKHSSVPPQRRVVLTPPSEGYRKWKAKRGTFWERFKHRWLD